MIKCNNYLLYLLFNVTFVLPIKIKVYTEDFQGLFIGKKSMMQYTVLTKNCLWRKDTMEFKTVEKWDELLWNEAEKIYEDAFPAHSRKKSTLIQKMFEKKMCFLHIAFIENEMVAMALSGKIDNPEILILDYIAVKNGYQLHGIGRKFVEYIKNWSHEYEKFSLIVVEVEADEDLINKKRIEFWTKCGFHLTDYVHSYIWVPETYKAMFYSIKPTISPDGQDLFSYITEFHKKGYKGT